jgi:dienelactone hydrolase
VAEFFSTPAAEAGSTSGFFGIMNGFLRPLIPWLAAITSVAAQERPVAEFVRETTPEGIEFGLWGEQQSEKAVPALVILAGDIEGTLGSAYFRQCGNELAGHGFLCISIDLPAHGRRVETDEASGLGGWRQLAERGTDFVAANNARLGAVLDHLVQAGRIDPERIAICGTSRGGYLALQFAAYDTRIKAAAAFAPVTELGALREFEGAEDLPLVKELALARQAERLAGRPVWIVIGDRDERVGTENAVELGDRLKASAAAQGRKNRAEILVLPEPRGHTTPEGAPGLAAKWIREQLDSVTRGALDPAAGGADEVPGRYHIRLHLDDAEVFAVILK